MFFSEMFNTDVRVLAGIALRTLLVFIAVVTALRLSGKREIGQMTIVDFVILLLIANTVQNAMTGPDTSVTGGLTAALTLLGSNFVLTRVLYRNRRLRKFVHGSATMLVYHGHVLEDHLERERITIEELEEAIREHGIANASDAGLAVLEMDGTISVLKRDEMPQMRTPRKQVRYLRKK